MPAKWGKFYAVLTEAVRDMTENGFDGVKRLEGWVIQIREAAAESMAPLYEVELELAKALGAVYAKLVDKGGLLKLNPDMKRFNLERVRPELRAELDRRIMGSAGLIKLNRERAVEQTMQRFQGWATSIPAGGSKAVNRGETKTDIRKSLASLPFTERRLNIDQGHKLASALNDVVAKGNGAIAAVWHSHWREKNYNFREDHKERDAEIYAVRGNWAQAKGLMKPGPNGYTDEITQPGEEVYCRCFYQYLFHLRELPPDMITKKGESELERVRMAMAS